MDYDQWGFYVSLQVHNPYNPLYPAQPGYQDIYSGTRWKKHRDSKYKIQRKTRWHSFLFSCRTGFNNIVPYNATRQGMPGYELPGVLRDPLMTVRPSKEHNFAIFATYQLNPGFIGGPSRQVWQLHLRANWPDGRHCDEVRALPLPLPHRVLLDRGRRPPHHVGEDWQEPKVAFLKSFHYMCIELSEYYGIMFAGQSCNLTNQYRCKSIPWAQGCEECPRK